MAMIEVENLVKEYKVAVKAKGVGGAVKNLFNAKKKIVRAVDHINFSIEPGEIVAYIGPNGAGKSTTVKMMSGILTPTSGRVLVRGVDPQKDRKKVVQNLGVVFGQRSQLNWDLRLGESFELLRRIYQVDKESFKKNLKKLDDILEFEKFINTPVRQLSLGQRMRGDLAAAMIHKPDVLFLDEPTIGLDVDGKYAIRKFIKEMNEHEGTTIILTTHDLNDIQELCKRLMIINNGKIIEDGSLEELIDRIAPYRQLVVTFSGEERIEHPKAQIISAQGNTVIYQFQKNELSAAELIENLSSKAKVKDIQIQESGIDDVIRTAYHQCD